MLVRGTHAAHVTTLFCLSSLGIPIFHDLIHTSLLSRLITLSLRTSTSSPEMAVNARQCELRIAGWASPRDSRYLFGTRRRLLRSIIGTDAKNNNIHANLPTQTACLLAMDCQPRRNRQPATVKIVVRGKELFERGVGASVSLRARVWESQSIFGWHVISLSGSGHRCGHTCTLCRRPIAHLVSV